MLNMKNQDKIAIIILGPPGSGKGTQAELLAKRLDLYHLETSEIIEKNLDGIKRNDFVIVGGKKYFIWEEKELRKSGEIMSPLLIAFWVKNKIRKLAKEGEGIVFSGSPRTVHEAQEITPLLKKLYGSSNIQIILIKQKLETSIWRNSRRRTCALMRHPILFTKETNKLKICPLDGSKLVVRKDDNPKVIKTRLKEYKERTLPLIDYFKKQGLGIKEVSGEKTVAEVFHAVITNIN